LLDLEINIQISDSNHMIQLNQSTLGKHRNWAEGSVHKVLQLMIYRCMVHINTMSII